MAQEAIVELDMDVFSRRISPYFSWLESRIESGWEQSDSVTKNVLKETSQLATTMRARFILGVSKDDFVLEVKRTIELFELASEAFPNQSDEVDAKLSHFLKGIREELGAQFIPDEHQSPKVELSEPAPSTVVQEKSIVEPQAPVITKPVKSVVQKIPDKKIKTSVKPKTTPKQVPKPAVKAQIKAPLKTKSKEMLEKKDVQKSQPKQAPKKSKSSILQWVKNFIYGDE